MARNHKKFHKKIQVFDKDILKDIPERMLDLIIDEYLLFPYRVLIYEDPWGDAEYEEDIEYLDLEEWLKDDSTWHIWV
jgi:hypothetical protein